MGQANCSVALYALINGVWTTLDEVQPYRGSWGMSDNNPVTRLADTGELKFALNNRTGQYTPGGPSALTGWRKGIPVKLVCTYENDDYIRFFGRISDIDIRPNVKDKKAYVTILDYMDYAAIHPIVNPGIQTDQRGDEVLTTIVNEIEIPPQFKTFDTGQETFPTVFDTITSKTKAYNEFAKVALSELGYVYLRKDKTNGENLVFEAADARHGWRAVGTIPVSTTESDDLLLETGDLLLLETGAPDNLLLNQTQLSTFGGTGLGDVPITDFDAPYGVHIINRLTVSANPRRLDSSAQALFSLDEELIIGSGQTYTLKGTYADPNGGLPINGQDMVTPVVTTDYTMFTAAGGGGSNISASLTVSITYGTEGFTATLTNGNANTGYVNFFQTRGTGIYQYNPIEHASRNAASVAEFETQSESLNQKYKNDLYAASVWADSQVDEYNQPRIVLNSISFIANRSPACMMAFLSTDVGDLRFIDIDELGISGNYYVQGVEFTMNNGIISVKWIVVAALSMLSGLSPLAVEFAGGSSGDAVNYGYLPAVSGDQITHRGFSAWIYGDTLPPGSDNYYIISPFTDENGLTIFFSDNGSDLIPLLYSKRFAVVGQWYGNIGIVLSGWRHIFITFDHSSTSNDPVFYVNGSLVTTVETLTPSGAAKSEEGCPLVIGNWKTSTMDYNHAFDGKMFDVRIYDMSKTTTSAANISSLLYNSGTPDETLVTDGLVFQAFTVRDEDLADYVDDTLTSTMLLRDNIRGAVGTPHGSPIGRAAP